MIIVLEGMKTTGEPFRKEIEKVDLSPLKNCTKLEEIHLTNNPLMDILWEDDSIIPEKLPRGLIPFLEDIQSAVKKQ